ncbi:MAG: DUF1501 domain-containing protein [Pseudomonadales bacterium]|jgi:uncharacterized protein (DUF1501 family)|nr:DUF1501 domain-containing protein [Pseudomonadales bacterium]
MRRGFSRRAFLGRSIASSAGFSLTGTSLMQLGAAAHAQSAGGYRALVCILLAGGADSFNMLVPTDDDGYGEYAGIRSDLALARETLAALAGTHQGGRTFGLHEALAPLAPLFDEGELAWVVNAGSLVEPTTPQAVQAGTARLPLGLYSHADQIEQWQTSLADARSGVGVGGRIADLLGDVNPTSPISMNVSTSGTNVFQSGAVSREFSIDPREGGAPSAAGYARGDEGSPIIRPAVNAILAESRRNLLRGAYGARFAEALAAGEAFNAALASPPSFTTAFAEDPFSQQLRLIANVIASRDALAVNRQTFFVTYGGWDHHDGLIENQARMLPAVAAGLTAFRDAMVQLGTHGDVTTFTISDFGRTLTSNGRGSDHGWGGNQLVLGGSVAGGALYGEFPELAQDAPLDTGRGRFIPTLSVDEFYADLALWFGLAPSDLSMVIPNIGRFYTPGGAPPIGFMS